MSEEREARIALLQEAIEAYNREDFETLKRAAHPDVEVQRPGGLGVTVGRDAVAERMAPDVFEQQRLELHGIELRGDVAIVEATLHARGSGSGIEINQRSWMVYRFAGALIRRLEVYHDRDEALAAVGDRD